MTKKEGEADEVFAAHEANICGINVLNENGYNDLILSMNTEKPGGLITFNLVKKEWKCVSCMEVLERQVQSY